MCLRMIACSIGFDFYPSQHQEGLRLHVHGGKGLCQDQLCNWHVRLTFSCQGRSALQLAREAALVFIME